MHRYCSVHETRLLTRILLCMQHKLFLQRKNPPNKRATPANAPRVDQTRAPPHQNTPPVHTKSLCSPDLALYLGQKCKDCNDKKTSAKVVNFPPPGVFFVLVKRDPTPILIVREAYLIMINRCIFVTTPTPFISIFHFSCCDCSSVASRTKNNEILMDLYQFIDVYSKPGVRWSSTRKRSDSDRNPVRFLVQVPVEGV